MLRLETHLPTSLVSEETYAATLDRARTAQDTLLNGSGAGNDYLGWRDLLRTPNDALLEDLDATASRIQADADVLLSLGIGGSYLGAKAVIQALTPYFRTTSEGRPPEVLFAGHHMSGTYMRQLLEHLEGKSVYVNVISKSGTTLETALAFRLVRDWMEQHFDDADDRIIITTDPEKGALNALLSDHTYKKYVIPRDVGGRFSVLTPVGLLPVAVAGIDIRALFYGAVSGFERFSSSDEDNPALTYAATRNAAYDAGMAIEVLANFEPRLSGIGAWWQQLYGESEGKEHKGLYPATAQYSTDLHSLGQYMQEGPRHLLETFLMLERDGGTLTVPELPANLDGLNYLSGQTYTHINRQAYEGTLKAHQDGGVPTMTLWMDALTPERLGEVLYFFEHAVAVSGYMLEVNPFDQPGVEAYKKEMFRLLGRPS